MKAPYDTRASDIDGGKSPNPDSRSTPSGAYFVIATSGGCPSNLLEAAAWRKHFDGQGLYPASGPESADVIVVNTCAVRTDMEEVSTHLIQDYQQRFGHQKRILVAGCLEGINPQRLHDVFSGEVVRPPAGDLEFQASQHHFDAIDFARLDPKHKVVLFLRSWYFAVERRLGRRFQPLHNLLRTVMVNEQYYLLTVATGCLGGCTYCGIRNAKGRVRSRPLDDVIREFDQRLAEGVTDFWLIADDLGCWGQDLGSSLPELLTAILSRRKNFSIVINYLDPSFLLRYATELAEIFEDKRIALVNIPIQSGSVDTLKRMGRSAEIGRTLAWVKAIKKKNRSLVVKTNVMVGFPGESWLDLARTWTAVFSFDATVALAFSPRPNTAAAEFPHQRGDLTKRVRLKATNVVVTASHLCTLARSLVTGAERP